MIWISAVRPIVRLLGSTMTDLDPGQVMTIEAYKRIKAQQEKK